MTLAAVDRLVHHATIFEMNVESYRRRSAMEAHCLAETVPEYSTVASHNLLPTEGYEQGRLWDS